MKIRDHCTALIGIYGQAQVGAFGIDDDFERLASRVKDPACPIDRHDAEQVQTIMLGLEAKLPGGQIIASIQDPLAALIDRNLQPNLGWLLSGRVDVERNREVTFGPVHQAFLGDDCPAAAMPSGIGDRFPKRRLAAHPSAAKNIA
jgi:hypothetical protein